MRRSKGQKPRAPKALEPGVALMVTMTAEGFFLLLQESSWDRPSAFYEFATRAGITKPPALCMHAADGGEPEKLYLESIFGKGRIPPTLMSRNWDT